MLAHFGGTGKGMVEGIGWGGMGVLTGFEIEVETWGRGKRDVRTGGEVKGGI